MGFYIFLNGDIFKDAVDTAALIVQLFVHDTRRKSALFPELIAPLACEDSYQAALLHVMQMCQWLGSASDAAVPLLTLKGEWLAVDFARRAKLNFLKRTLIELVCHHHRDERDGPESRHPRATVAGRVKKLVKKYSGPLFPIYEHLGHVNFGTEREYGQGNDLKGPKGPRAVLHCRRLALAVDCNLMNVVVELEPHVAVPQLNP